MPAHALTSENRLQRVCKKKTKYSSYADADADKPNRMIDFIRLRFQPPEFHSIRDADVKLGLRRQKHELANEDSKISCLDQESNEICFLMKQITKLV